MERETAHDSPPCIPTPRRPRPKPRRTATCSRLPWELSARSGVGLRIGGVRTAGETQGRLPPTAAPAAPPPSLRRQTIARPPPPDPLGFSSRRLYVLPSATAAL